MDTSIFNASSKIGPGVWFVLHLDGIHAITDELKRHYEKKVNKICDNFKCQKCQTHFRKFIDTHPFANYWHIRDNKNRDIGFFQWSWELHNQVNKFLGKYSPTLSEAYDYYNDSQAGVCVNCGKDDSLQNANHKDDSLQNANHKDDSLQNANHKDDNHKEENNEKKHSFPKAPDHILKSFENKNKESALNKFADPFSKSGVKFPDPFSKLLGDDFINIDKTLASDKIIKIPTTANNLNIVPRKQYD